MTDNDDTGIIGTEGEPIKTVHATVEEFLEQVQTWADGPGDFELRVDRIELDHAEGTLEMTSDDAVVVKWRADKK